MIYVLQVMSGKELSVLSHLSRKEISAAVPRERILIRKNGLWSKMLKLLFPAYVFVDIDYTPEIFHKINAVDGVIRFLGSPSPLPDHEADMIRWLSDGGEVIEPSTFITDKNGNITAFKGFLNGNEDRIKFLNIRQKKASIEVKFGGKTHRANISIQSIADAEQG